jgi:CubicO group peptidase (beta-lactamase class C family)
MQYEIEVPPWLNYTTWRVSIKKESTTMLKRGLIAVFGLFLALLTGLALLYFRPWAEFRPSTMNSLFKPENRLEYFRSMERVFPSRPILASTEASAFAVGNKITLPANFAAASGQQATGEFLDRTDTTSLVVIKNGQLVFEQYYKGAKADSRLTSWSVAKSFLSTLVGIALSEGKIKSLDDKVSVYLPELAGKPYGDSTVLSLLQMASGIRFDETYSNPLADINTLFYRTFIFDQRVNSVVANHERLRPPSTLFNYISSDSQVLSHVLARATGVSVADYLQAKLWQPLGMQRSAFWSLDRGLQEGGQELGFCCLNATARDFAKLGQLYLQQGQWQGKTIVPAQYIQLATRPQRAFQQPDPKRYDAMGYALHWWVPANRPTVTEQTEFMARGVWGQSIWVDQARQTVIVRTAVDPKYRDNWTTSIALFRAISDLE